MKVATNAISPYEITATNNVIANIPIAWKIMQVTQAPDIHRLGIVPIAKRAETTHIIPSSSPNMAQHTIIQPKVSAQLITIHIIPVTDSLLMKLISNLRNVGSCKLNNFLNTNP